MFEEEAISRLHLRVPLCVCELKLPEDLGDDGDPPLPDADHPLPEGDSGEDLGDDGALWAKACYATGGQPYAWHAAQVQTMS